VKSFFSKKENEEIKTEKIEIEIPSEKEKEMCMMKLNEMKSIFDFGEKSDEEILNALLKEHGNIDGAINLLFQ